MDDFFMIGDVFEAEEPKKINESRCSKYVAFCNDPCWFLSNSDVPDNSKSSSHKFRAGYLFMIKDYMGSIEAYKQYMDKCLNLNLSAKREVLEGISRSYLGLHCYCYALKYADQLKKLSSTFDSQSVSLSLKFDCLTKAQRFQESIRFAQMIVTLHSSDVDAWLSLAHAYANAYNVSLSQPIKPTQVVECQTAKHALTCNCENVSNRKYVEESNHFIAMSLLHAQFHLKSILKTKFNFPYERNSKVLKMIEENLEHLKVDAIYTKLFKAFIMRKFNQKERNDEATHEFVDRASSKFKSAEQVTINFEEFNSNLFVETWLEKLDK